MSELDRVLDTLMDAKRASIEGRTSKEEENELIDALKEKKKAQIIEEIKATYREEIFKEAEEKLKKKTHKKKIDELRELMWNGFILAFVVGLAVNQVTDVIGYYKGSVALEKIWPTSIIIAILLVICVLFYFYYFMRNALSLVNEKNDEE